MGETRSRAVVVVSQNKAGRTALYHFYVIYVPRRSMMGKHVCQVGSDDGLVCFFFDVLVAHMEVPSA